MPFFSLPPLPVFNGHIATAFAKNNAVTGDRSGAARFAPCCERVIDLYETRKKRWLSFLFSCLLAFSLITPAWAAEGERTLIPLGKAVGIKLFADGALVVSLEGSDTLKVGDLLLKVNDTRVQSTEQLQALLQKNGSMPVSMQVRRGERLVTFTDTPQCGSDGVYRLGAWIRDSMAGIGTLTYYDPQTASYGALGHGITDMDTAQLMSLSSGSIMETTVKAVKKGERASPGELKGDFDLTRDSGTLYANTECGIFGKLSAEDAAKIVGAALPIAKKDEVKTGKATILATVSGNETREYDIEIEKIYSPSGSTRNLLLRVTDEELLAQTGGVVQGMSGSAILQDGKIIGAVTHVLLDDPSRGYGIFIENMLSAAGLSSE